MTIDEAIKHCQEVAEDNERDSRLFNDLDSYKASECAECASEHRQLAEWLKELRYLRNLVSFAEYHNVSIKRAKEELSRHEVEK